MSKFGIPPQSRRHLYMVWPLTRFTPSRGDLPFTQRERSKLLEICVVGLDNRSLTYCFRHFLFFDMWLKGVLASPSLAGTGQTGQSKNYRNHFKTKPVRYSDYQCVFEVQMLQTWIEGLIPGHKLAPSWPQLT